MQTKCGVENVDGPGREQTLVKGTRNASGEVGAVSDGSRQAVLHGATTVVGGQGWQELEESVEVIGLEIREEDRELRRLVAGGLVALGDVLDNSIRHVEGVAAAGTPQVGDHERHAVVAATHYLYPIQGFFQKMKHRSSMLSLHTYIYVIQSRTCNCCMFSVRYIHTWA